MPLARQRSTGTSVAGRNARLSSHPSRSPAQGAQPADSQRNAPASRVAAPFIAPTEGAAGPDTGETRHPRQTAGAPLGQFTDGLHAELIAAGKAAYCHRDDHAFVLTLAPTSEDRQKKLIRMTIDSAEKFAIITSFNVNPAKDHDPEKISGTMFAILESLARKQHDKDFSFVLFYNDNKLQTNAVISAVVGQNVTTNMSLRSSSRTHATTTWPAVVKAYNRQQTDASLKITRPLCNLYFVAAKAKGVAGSHHNKFCINDKGVAATLGASLANKTKDSWMDGGCVTLSQPLAARQRDYFLDELIGRHTVHGGQLQVNSDGELVMEKMKDLSRIQALGTVDIESPLDQAGPHKEQAVARLRDSLAQAGVEFDGAAHKVLWVQNTSSGYKNMFSTRGHIEGKPIGQVMSRFFSGAQPGETINIVNKTIGSEGMALITDALARGCNVNVLINEDNRAALERAARKFFAHPASSPVGTLNLRHFAPSETLATAQHFNTAEQAVGHAKNYILERQDGSSIVMTGSYNLDGQSHYRSNENLMLFETRGHAVKNALFDDLYNGCDSPISTFSATVKRRG
ncbi:phospholipase D-like domain-containing protein [Acidovorax sp. SUPP2539]|uniref:phospholipase D-like domain-containing protein n=1 Tax=Acidovorax sp. SUPP2539 TaxID=2920878 RepID=UPI0023DE4B5B|nr:phospholipase D-like domain-containing protein [Acidovorax sp. SUPP2539]GKS91867.1 hypothetical protein AVTE2539_20900 [Acidovorax sp. SUPP2539]